MFPLLTTLQLVRLHIVLIAVLGTLTFQLLFSGDYMWDLAVLCGFDWLLVNLLNRVVDQREDLENEVVAADLSGRVRKWVITAGLAAGLSSLYIGHCYWPAITPWRLLAWGLALAYNWPIPGLGKRLKELYFWKNIASATGFMTTVFAYPLALSAASGRLSGFGPRALLTLGIFFFLFELSFEVIYDLRDVAGDRLSGIATYPVVHGERIAAGIINALLAVAMLLLGVGYAASWIPWRVFVMILAPSLQMAYCNLIRFRIREADCINLTLLCASLLLVYNLWSVFKLPGVE